MMTISFDVEDIARMSAKEKRQLDMLLGPDLALQSVPRKWSPRAYQQAAWDYLENGGTHCCLIWHRRSGKDDIALNWTAVAAHKRIGEYWHMLPEASQGRKAIWEAVSPHTGIRRIDQAFPRDLRAQTRDNDMVIRFKNGSLWRVVGSDNYESLLGSTPVGIIFSEWALADPNAYGFLRPILAENGGWVVFITTPRGSNHARVTYDGLRNDPEAFAQVLTNDETGVFTQAQLKRELEQFQHDYGEEEGRAFFEQEYFCSFEAAMVGSYYGPYLARMAQSGRICNIPIDRAMLVHTSWDLGVSDSTAIWFIQCVGKERRLIDYHEGSGVGLDEYARVLQEKQRQHGYLYGQHFFPHDVEFRELGNRGLSRVDTLRGLGIKVTVVPQHNVNDGINAVRRMLDSTWLDEKRCERGLNALRNYHRDWSDKTEMYADKPYHNWASHGADALRCFACGYRDPKDKGGVPWPKLPPMYDNVPAERGTGWMGH